MCACVWCPLQGQHGFVARRTGVGGSLSLALAADETRATQRLIRRPTNRGHAHAPHPTDEHTTHGEDTETRDARTPTRVYSHET